MRDDFDARKARIGFESPDQLELLIASDSKLWGEFFRDQRDNMPTRDNSEAPGVSRTQMRKFFEDILVINGKLSAGVDYSALYASVLMLKPKAAYAKKRGLVSEKFLDFWTYCVDEATRGKVPEKFRRFVVFFEAVYAYFYANSRGGE